MTFNEIRSPGINATCKNCGVATYFNGYQRYRVDDDNKVLMIPEYQCQDCGKIICSMPDIPENKEILSERCQCGGQYRRDKPLFCPSCNINKTSLNQSDNMPNDSEELYADSILNEKVNNIRILLLDASAHTTDWNEIKSNGNTGYELAKELLDGCMPYLEYIKNKAGINDEIYKALTDEVAVMASSIITLPVKASASGHNLATGEHDWINDVEHQEYLAFTTIILSLNLSSGARQTVFQNLTNRSRKAVIKNLDDTFGKFHSFVDEVQKLINRNH